MGVLHPLASFEHADRMTTEYATSPDGVRLDVARDRARRPARRVGRPRACASASVVRSGDAVLATYDGRATARENWEERTGTAHATRAGVHSARSRAADGAAGRFAPRAARPALRLHVALADGRCRLYYEATRADGAHELRTELL